MRALEPWVEAPLQSFLAESSARLTLLMTSSGQVVAQQLLGEPASGDRHPQPGGLHGITPYTE